MAQKKIAVFVGSLRKESFNRKMAEVLIKVSPDSLKLEIIEIGTLPLYTIRTSMINHRLYIRNSVNL